MGEFKSAKSGSLYRQLFFRGEYAILPKINAFSMLLDASEYSKSPESMRVLIDGKKAKITVELDDE